MVKIVEVEDVTDKIEKVWMVEMDNLVLTTYEYV